MGSTLLDGALLEAGALMADYASGVTPDNLQTRVNTIFNIYGMWLMLEMLE